MKTFILACLLGLTAGWGVVVNSVQRARPKRAGANPFHQGR